MPWGLQNRPPKHEEVGSRVRKGAERESKSREEPPVTPVKSRGMDSHTRLELCTTLWEATAEGTAPYGDLQGARPVTRALPRKAPAPTHRDYLSHCDRGIRWSFSTFFALFHFPLLRCEHVSPPPVPRSICHRDSRGETCSPFHGENTQTSCSQISRAPYVTVPHIKDALSSVITRRCISVEHISPLLLVVPNSSLCGRRSR